MPSTKEENHAVFPQEEIGPNYQLRRGKEVVYHIYSSLDCMGQQQNGPGELCLPVMCKSF